MSIFNTVKDVLSIKVLRKRLMYTALFAFIYRLGTFVLLPWLDSAKVFAFMQQSKEKSFWDRMLSTSFDSYSIFSLGIGPYITASILVQLSSFVIPYFQRLEREGSSGRNKLEIITRWLTIPAAIAQSLMQLYSINRDIIIGNTNTLFWYYPSCVLLLVSGAMFAIWLADKITSKGIGNGSSVLIMVNAVAGLPRAIISEVTLSNHGAFFLLIEFIIMFIIVLCIVLFMQGVRKINLQYARQIISSQGTIEKHQYLPVKMNATGVMPIISANVLVGIIVFISGLLDSKLGFRYAGYVSTALRDPFGWKRNAFQAFIIFGMSMVYMTIFVNPLKIANELKRSNAFISGIQPGKATADFIDKITTRVVFPGAIFLVFISIIPAIVVSSPISIHKDFAHFYGGTTLLIIVGVIINITEQVEGYLNMHYYDKMMQESQDIPYM